MSVVAVVLAALAALLHVYIWVLESFRWTHPSTLATFGVPAEHAEATRPLAFNQGFYNLFLAVVTGVGLVVMSGDGDVGTALALAGTASMLAAAVVLVASDRSRARPAVIQGTLPLLAIVAFAV